MDLADERGSVLVLVALSLMVLLVAAALAIDVGNWFGHKRHLQLQVDAAALAGGGVMGECFVNTAAAADSDIQNTASAYSGAKQGAATNAATGYASPADSTKNTTAGQFSASNQGSLSVYYNSRTFPNGQAEDSSPATVTGGPCASQMLDVKASEQNLPIFFGGIVGLSVVPSINAHARVQLFSANSGKGDLPLVIPDVNPAAVWVTLWNQSGSAGAVSSALADAGPDSSRMYLGAPLEKWQGTVTLPAASSTSTMGVRVGMSIVPLTGAPPSCFNQKSDTTAGWYCFDQSSKTTPLGFARAASGTAAFHTPVLDSVTGSTCAGGTNPFFSDVPSDLDATSKCSVAFSAAVRWVACPAHTTCQFNVTLTTLDFSGSTTTTTQAGSGTGTYTFSLGSYPAAFGQIPATFSWSYTMTPAAGWKFPGGSSCDAAPVVGTPSSACTFPSSGTTAFPPSNPAWLNGTNILHGQVWSADPSPVAAGPVKEISISPQSYTSNGSPSTATVTVEVQGKLGNTPSPSPLIALRSDFGGSRSGLVQCTPAGSYSGNDPTQNGVQFGCSDIYQRKLSGTCPDTPPSPPDCIPVETGSHGGSLASPMARRFTPRPPNNWGGSVQANDPRMLQLWVTDYLALLGVSGSGKVPVTGLGYFYLTGWGYFQPGQPAPSAACPANEAPPSTLVAKSTDFFAFWGHFVKFINASDGTDLSPCVPSPFVDVFSCTVRLTQ